MRNIFYYVLVSISFLQVSHTLCAQSEIAKLDDWLEKNTPAMGGRSVLMVYKDGEIIYSKTVNKMNRRQQWVARQLARRMGKDASMDPFSIKSRQPIASCSKWLSAALVMTFVDDGSLSLSDTVGKFLPILSQHGKGNITIEQCLSHRTGILSPQMEQELRELKNRGSNEEEIVRIAEMPMEGEPGKVFRYSNVGLQILGSVLEKISGKGFEQLFVERIANPLRMPNTDFGHARTVLPAGGARSTPQEYMRFLTMILNRGTFEGKRILSEQSVDQMQVDRVINDVQVGYSPTEAKAFGYGYGEWVMEKAADGASITVTSPGLFGSFPWVDNKRKYCAFLMTMYIKSDGRNDRYRSLKQLVDNLVQTR